MERSLIVDKVTGLKYPANDPLQLEQGLSFVLHEDTRRFVWRFTGKKS